MSRRTRPLKLNEVVRVGSRTGRIQSAVNYSKARVVVAVQAIRVQFSENRKDSAYIHYHRDHREMNIEPIVRVGEPPEVKPGDEVRSLFNDKIYRATSYADRFSGLVQATTFDGSRAIDLEWPNYRKVKTAKTGLGQFRRGDWVKFVKEPKPPFLDKHWFQVLELEHCAAGKRRLRLCSEDKSKAFFYVYSDEFCKLLRSPWPDCPAEKPLELPNDVPLVNHCQDSANSLVGLGSDCNVDQAALIGDLDERLRILSATVDRLAVAVEKINARLG